MDELVEDEVLEVVELDDVELEVMELDVVLLKELEVPRDQESALPISGLTKKRNKGRSLLSDV